MSYVNDVLQTILYYWVWCVWERVQVLIAIASGHLFESQYTDTSKLMCWSFTKTNT